MSSRPFSAPVRPRKARTTDSSIPNVSFESALPRLHRIPNQLVPLRIDSSTNRPFDYVLDILHLSNFTSLRYYAQPIPDEQPIVASTTTNLPRSSAQTPQSMMATFGATKGAPTPPMKDGGGGNSRTISPSLGGLKSQHHSNENMATTYLFDEGSMLRGEILLVGAKLSPPDVHNTYNVGIYTLEVPNHRYYLKPRNNEQNELLLHSLPRWIEVANTPYYNSEFAFLRIAIQTQRHERYRILDDAADSENEQDERKEQDHQEKKKRKARKAAAATDFSFKDAETNVQGIYVILRDAGGKPNMAASNEDVDDANTLAIENQANMKGQSFYFPLTGTTDGPHQSFGPKHNNSTSSSAMDPKATNNSNMTQPTCRHKDGNDNEDGDEQPREAYRSQCLLTVPFDLSCSKQIGFTIDHFDHGRLVPLEESNLHYQRSLGGGVDIAALFGRYNSWEKRLCIPLTDAMGTQKKGMLSVWCAPPQHSYVKLCMNGINMFRRNFIFSDPFFRLRLRITNSAENGENDDDEDDVELLSSDKEETTKLSPSSGDEESATRRKQKRKKEKKQKRIARTKMALPSEFETIYRSEVYHNLYKPQFMPITLALPPTYVPLQHDDDATAIGHGTKKEAKKDKNSKQKQQKKDLPFFNLAHRIWTLQGLAYEAKKGPSLKDLVPPTINKSCEERVQRQYNRIHSAPPGGRNHDKNELEKKSARYQLYVCPFFSPQILPAVSVPATSVLFQPIIRPAAVYNQQANAAASGKKQLTMTEGHSLENNNNSDHQFRFYFDNQSSWPTILLNDMFACDFFDAEYDETTKGTDPVLMGTFTFQLKKLLGDTTQFVCNQLEILQKKQLGKKEGGHVEPQILLTWKGEDEEKNSNVEGSEKQQVKTTTLAVRPQSAPVAHVSSGASNKTTYGSSSETIMTSQPQKPRQHSPPKVAVDISRSAMYNDKIAPQESNCCAMALTSVAGGIKHSSSQSASHRRDPYMKIDPCEIRTFLPKELEGGSSYCTSAVKKKGSGYVQPTKAFVSHVSLHNRLTFQHFLSAGWELSSYIIIDFCPEANTQHRTQCFVNGWNSFHGLIVSINKMMLPFTSRAGSELYGCGITMPDMQFSVYPVHQYPEIFSTHVDEMATATASPWYGGHPKSPRKRGAQTEENAATTEVVFKQSSASSSNKQPFSNLRDWSGENTLGYYDAKRVITNRSGANFALPYFLCPVIRRLVMRCDAIQKHRTVGCENFAESAKGIPKNIFHVVWVLIAGDQDPADTNEAIEMLRLVSAKPILFVFVFIDSTAPRVFHGLSNVLTVDFKSSSGGFLQMHHSLHALQRAFSRIPVAFLSWARMNLVSPDGGKYCASPAATTSNSEATTSIPAQNNLVAFFQEGDLQDSSSDSCDDEPVESEEKKKPRVKEQVVIGQDVPSARQRPTSTNTAVQKTTPAARPSTARVGKSVAFQPTATPPRQAQPATITTADQHYKFNEASIEFCKAYGFKVKERVLEQQARAKQQAAENESEYTVQINKELYGVFPGPNSPSIHRRDDVELRETKSFKNASFAAGEDGLHGVTMTVVDLYMDEEELRRKEREDRAVYERRQHGNSPDGSASGANPQNTISNILMQKHLHQLKRQARQQQLEAERSSQRKLRNATEGDESATPPQQSGEKQEGDLEILSEMKTGKQTLWSVKYKGHHDDEDESDEEGYESPFSKPNRSVTTAGGKKRLLQLAGQVEDEDASAGPMQKLLKFAMRTHQKQVTCTVPEPPKLKHTRDYLEYRGATKERRAYNVSCWKEKCLKAMDRMGVPRPQSASPKGGKRGEKSSSTQAETVDWQVRGRAAAATDDISHIQHELPPKKLEFLKKLMARKPPQVALVPVETENSKVPPKMLTRMEEAQARARNDKLLEKARFEMEQTELRRAHRLRQQQEEETEFL